MTHEIIITSSAAGRRSFVIGHESSYVSVHETTVVWLVLAFRETTTRAVLWYDETLDEATMVA